MTMPPPIPTTFDQLLGEWQKKLLATQATQEFLVPQITTIENELTAAEKALQIAQSPRAAATAQSLGEPAISFLGPTRKEREATEAFEFAQDRIDAAREDLLFNIFFNDFYSIVPLLVQSGAVNTTDEALNSISGFDALNTRLQTQVREEVSQLLATRDRGTTTAIEIEGLEVKSSDASLDFPQLVAPTQRAPIAPQSIHQLTTQELLKTFRIPEAPATQMTDEEWNEYLSAKGWSEEEIADQDRIAVEQLVAEAQNRKNMIDAFRAEGATLPRRDALDIFQQAVITPSLVVLEGLNFYYEHVSMPAAGWLYGSPSWPARAIRKAFTLGFGAEGIPDIQAAAEEFSKANPGSTMREAYVYGWQKWDAPGPPVIDFVFKYILLEGLVDPLTYIGWGLVTKGLRALGPGGKVLAAGNSVVGEVLELPFDYIKYVAKEVFPKTISLRAASLSRETLSIVDQYVERYVGRPLTFIKPNEMFEAGEFAISHLAKNPRAEDDIAKAAEQFLLHPPVSRTEATNWIQRLRARGVGTVDPADLLDETILDIDTIFERVFSKELTVDEASPLLLNKFGVVYPAEVTEDLTVLAGKFMADRSNLIVDRALDFSLENSANAAMRSLGRKSLRIHETALESVAMTAATQSGRMQMLLFNIERGQIGAWTRTLDRMIIRPAAEAYLTFGMYGPMNVLEDVGRSILAGVKPGRMSVERWDMVTQGLRGDPSLRIKGLSEMIGPLRETGTAQRSNWILTMSLAPLSVPTWAATRGRLTPTQFAKNTYSTLVELFGGMGIDIRRNFVGGRYSQILADLGGDSYKLLDDIVPSNLPSALDSAPRWVRRNLQADLHAAVTSGQLTTDNSAYVQLLKDRYTHNRVVRAEVNDIIMKYEDLSPTARSLTLDAFDEKRLLESPDTIDSSMKQILDAEVDDFLRGPERAAQQYDDLTKILLDLEVTNPADMTELMVSLHRMTATYGALPDQIMARATVKSRGLPLADRRLQFDTEFDRLAVFMDRAGASIDNVVDKIKTSTTAPGFTPAYQDAVGRYHDIVTTTRKLISEAKAQDAAFRSQHFAGITPKQMNATFWDDFYATENAFWRSQSKKMATLNSQLHRAMDDINTAAGIKFAARPAVVVRGRPLAPADVAQLMGAKGDDVSKLLLDTLLPEGDKDYFTEYVLGLVREGYDDGFDRASVEAVYDQIADSILVDPTDSSWFRSRQKQLGAMTRDFHDLYNSKLFPAEQKVAVDGLIDDMARGADEVVFEPIVPDKFLVASEELAQAQRGAPETAMNRIQNSQIAQLYGFVAEHLGDITNRMSELVERGSGNFTDVVPKVRRTLNALREPFGFEKEFTGQIRTNLREVLEGRAPVSGFEGIKTETQGLARLKQLGQAYADEHKKLVTVNRAQTEARDAAVALGEFRFEDAVRHLEVLEEVIEQGREAWDKFALEGIRIAGIEKRVIRPEFGAEAFTVPVTEPGARGIVPETFKQTKQVDYDGLRQHALDEAHKWYFKEYPDYTNANAFDAVMKKLYPFWTYESQRWFWLPRSFLRHPGTLTAWGRWQNNTENGYLHIPGTSIDINPLRGTVYGTWSTRMARRDYPEYYDQLEGFGGVVEFFDFFSRYGFYPNVIYGGLLAQFGGSSPQTGGILPAAASTPLNAMIAAFPDNPLVTFISERIFPEQFRQYLTSRAVDDLGADGSLIFAKMKANQDLTDDEKALWAQARQTVAAHSAAFEQFGMFRMKSDESLRIKEAAELFIEEQWGITPEQQRAMRNRGEKLWDFIGGLDPWETAVIQELEFFKYSGSINPVLPGRQQEILNRIELDWADVMAYSDSMNAEIVELQEDFLIGSDRGRLGPDAFLARVRELQRARSAFIDKKTEANPLMLLENRTDYYEKYGQTMPVQSPYNELLDMFFSVELEDTVDPNTGERILDWDKFWSNRDFITDAIPEADKGQWETFLARNTAPIMAVWQNVSRTYFRKYDGLWDEVLSTYNEEEQTLIEEYLFLERTQQKLDRQQEIKTTLSAKDGSALISGFRSSVSAERKALRFANPQLDAWLFYWGRTSTFISHTGEEVFTELSRQTGRTID